MVATAFAIAAAAWWMSPRPASDSGVTPAPAARPARVSRGQTAQATAPAAKREAPAAVERTGSGRPAGVNRSRHRPTSSDRARRCRAAGAGWRARRSAFVAPQPEQRLGPDGSVSVDVPEDLHTFTVATRTADGKVVIEHATGAKGVGAQTRAGRQGPRRAQRRRLSMTVNRRDSAGARSCGRAAWRPRFSRSRPSRRAPRPSSFRTATPPASASTIRRPRRRSAATPARRSASSA